MRLNAFSILDIGYALQVPIDPNIRFQVSVYTLWSVPGSPKPLALVSAQRPSAYQRCGPCLGLGLGLYLGHRQRVLTLARAMAAALPGH